MEVGHPGEVNWIFSGLFPGKMDNVQCKHNFIRSDENIQFLATFSMNKIYT